MTEYSLMHHWKAHLNDTIPSQLATQYGRPEQWKVWEYIDYVQNDPVTRPEWVAFLQNSPWFENRKDYITNSYAQFTANAKFNIGTYASIRVISRGSTRAPIHGFSTRCS